MWVIGIGFILFSIVSSYILPWVNHTRIAELRRRIDWLQNELERLGQGREKSVPVLDPRTCKEPPPAPTVVPASAPPIPVMREEFAAEQAVPGLQPAREEEKTASSGGLENLFGGRAFVWLGGAALALAGFYLVKYSIESGLLTEQVRVVIGMMFGAGLLGASQIVRRFPRMADGTRIAQALAGAGIADLYGCLFAATTLYHLIPSIAGFAGMAAVTALALLLSLRHGAPIAVLGLLGGFATPMLIHSDTHTPLLFGYLFLVNGALAFISRRQKWWGLALSAALISLAWVVFWMLNGWAAVDATYIAVFLFGISATTFCATHDQDGNDALSMPALLRYAALVGSLGLMAFVTGIASYGPFEWGMFGLFSAATLTLAEFDSRTYGFAPWFAAAATAVTLLAWHGPDPTSFAVAVGTFGLLFAGVSYLLARGENAVNAALLSAATAFGYFFIAYGKLETTLPQIVGTAGISADALWGAIAFGASLLFAAATGRLIGAPVEATRRQQLQSIYSVAASSFVFSGFAILLHQDYLAFAIAGEILTLSWLGTKMDIPALRPIAGTLTAIFGVLLMPELCTLLAAPFAETVRDPETTHSVPSLIFRFGLPVAMFAVASEFLRKKSDDKFVGALEFFAITLIGMLGYDLLSLGLGGHNPQTAFIARALFTDILLLLSLAVVFLGRAYERPAVMWGGVIAACIALARIIGLDLIANNPLWTHEMVGSTPFINGLALAYLLPAIMLFLIAREAARADYQNFVPLAKVAALILGFIFVSLEVCQFYHGTVLSAGKVSNAEIYTYSAIWLALGIVLLLAGTVREDRMMRTGSLVIMLLTVGKVFLYDASELTGLWRVFSFFGLGLSLLALSWYYSRFVFKRPHG